MEADPDRDVYFSTGDIKDCFYHLGVPPGLEHWFSLPGIRAKFLPWCPEARNLPSDTWMVPLLNVLPMGWSWSLHLAQRSHETVGVRSGLSPSLRLVDKHSGVPLTTGGCRSAVYVDNFLIIGQDRDKVQEAERGHREKLEELGLPVHESTDGATDVDYVGLHFDGKNHEIRLSWNRLWRLRLGIKHIATLPRVSGTQLEKLVGHITWALLLRRECLSILSSVYVFIKRFYQEPALIWPSVRRELEQVAALLPLVVSNFGLRWDPVVLASDASDFGYGVMQQDVGSEIVGSWGAHL